MNKTQLQKSAEEKQITLLSEALDRSTGIKGYWLNVSGKQYPRFYPKGLAVSPFNALIMSLHSDKNGCKSNLFTTYNQAKSLGASVRENQKGVPFIFYQWNQYVHKNNPTDKISREHYLTLSAEEKDLYKGIHNKEIRTLFNIDQTLLPQINKSAYEKSIQRYGSSIVNGYTESDDKGLRREFNQFLSLMKENLVPIRCDGTGIAHYESDKDVVYIPRQKEFEHYNDYVQETLRKIITATGHQQRLAREGMVMKNGQAPSEDAVKREALVAELASGVKMLEFGLPARLSEDSIKHVDFWTRELREDPNFITAIESDVNNALEILNKAERGERIEYASYHHKQQTSQMQDMLPKHYYIADELQNMPSKENKCFVIVLDSKQKSADVVLPMGASLEVNNELPGLSKLRISKALQKEGIQDIKFFNPNGALGYRPDDKYFADKQITLARLKNWNIESLSHLDPEPAVVHADRMRFEQVQMIQDDEMKWTLYIKPEGQKGYCVYPERADLNQFFTTLKQSMNNLDKVRDELALKYYAMAQVNPSLKVNLFDKDNADMDLNQIQRVYLYKTKKDGLQLVATINGEKLEPRSVSLQQGQRLWLAEDMELYKKQLAATLYADILKISHAQTQSEHGREHEEVSQSNDEEERVSLSR